LLEKLRTSQRQTLFFTIQRRKVPAIWTTHFLIRKFRRELVEKLRELPKTIELFPNGRARSAVR
jgi:hypothetical protein